MLIHQTHTFKALGGANEIQLYARASEGDILFARAVGECRRIEEKFSRFRPESLISKINRAAGSSEEMEVDEETAALINYASAAFKATDGLFDISSGTLSRLWNFREQKIPSQEAIEQGLRCVGWDRVIWRPPFIRLPQRGMEIDFGGIGKEYAVDRVATLLTEQGVRSGLVNLGGDIRILGPHPDGRPWDVGITHPRLAREVLAKVGAFTGAIATSGDYERFFEIDGVRYCHIINPRSGRPATGVQAVTVFADACTVAGTAATAAMLFGAKKGLQYLEELDLPFLFVREDQSVVVHRSLRGGS